MIPAQPAHGGSRRLPDDQRADQGVDPGAPADGSPGNGPLDADQDGVPPEVAVRLLRALDRSPSTVVSLIGPDLRTQWLSHSSRWVTGTDSVSRRGRGSLERIHPDDVDRLLHALSQLQAARPRSARGVPVLEPIRYRLRDPRGEWVTMEALVLNLLDDPVVNGLVLVGRRVDGHLDGVGHVVDLLAADAPLTEVLAACAGLVPSFVGQAAVVAVLDDGPVVGAAPGSPAARLAADDRWWRQTMIDGEVRGACDFAGFPASVADDARAEGFRSAWALPVTDASGESLGCIVVWVVIDVELNVATDHGLRQARRLASLVIGEQRRQRALRREAVTDPLTGAGNRSALRRRLDTAGGAVTLALIDLDDFKPVNDTYGHDAGDAVLRVVARRLESSLRQDDLLVRFGGDEFAIVFGERTPTNGIVTAMARATHAIEDPIAVPSGALISVRASFGVATGTVDEVVRLADAALYAAKRRKRDDKCDDQWDDSPEGEPTDG